MLLFDSTITEGVLVGVICSNYTLVSVLAAVLVIGILAPCMAVYTAIGISANGFRFQRVI